MTPTTDISPLSVGQAAKALGVPACRVRRLYEVGLLEGERIGSANGWRGRLWLYRWSVAKLLREWTGEHE